jgi:hypothetical protein
MASKNIPFPFVLEELLSLDYTIKPMFGCHAIYSNGKIQIILRDRDDNHEVNGIWIATSHEHHESLRKDFPAMQSVSILNGGNGETNWQMLHIDADDFESSVIRLCELIKKNDPRIGRIPKPKKKKNRN